MASSPATDSIALIACLAFVSGLLFVPGAALAGDQMGKFCSQTATLAFNACGSEIKDDYAIGMAICLNVSDNDDREECAADAMETRQEGAEHCHEQLDARRALCGAIGEDRYDPDFDPASFDTNFVNPPNLNPHYPVKIGNHWEFEGAGEHIVVEVLNETKLVEGVTCVVVNDVVTVGGDPVEDTDDWIAQAKNGDVHYCGEQVKDFETFPGDSPMDPELVAIDGSFKAGRDGDKSGILFLREPEVGDVYRQEFSLGNAEDVAEVISTTYDHDDGSALNALVPQALANLLCDHDCVVTKEYAPIEPNTFALKYYAEGIGVFLEVTPASGEIVQLGSCNVDPRCALLPAP